MGFFGTDAVPFTIEIGIGILVYQVGIGGGVARFFGVAEELVVFVVAVVGHGDERSVFVNRIIIGRVECTLSFH